MHVGVLCNPNVAPLLPHETLAASGYRGNVCSDLAFATMAADGYNITHRTGRKVIVRPVKYGGFRTVPSAFSRYDCHTRDTPSMRSLDAVPEKLRVPKILV